MKYANSSLLIPPLLLLRPTATTTHKKKDTRKNDYSVITQYVAIDAQSMFYWHDKSVGTASDFISGIKNKTIHVRAMKRPPRYETPAIWKLFTRHMPYSLLSIFVIFGLVFWSALVFDRKFIANEFTQHATSSKDGGGGGLKSTKEYQQMLKEEVVVETKKEQ